MGDNPRIKTVNQPSNPQGLTAWALQKSFKGLSFDVDDDGFIKAQVVVLSDVLVDQGPVYRAAGATQNGTDQAMETIAQGYLWNGSAWARFGTGSSQDGSGGSGNSAAVQVIAADLINNGAIVDQVVQGANASVSAAHSANTLAFDIKHDTQYLGIDVGASGGTFTVTVKGSVDNTTWITLGATAASATANLGFYAAKNNTPDVKVCAYTQDATHGGISPLMFRYVQIIVGDAGVGNTTTTTVTIK